MRTQALLFGLNYAGTPSELRGCENDVRNVAAYLGGLGVPCTVRTRHEETTAWAIVAALHAICKRDDLDFIYIHFSGHGVQVRDDGTDERDGMDECIVPSDHETAGVIRDDFIRMLLGEVNPKTRVFAVFDCCHSGTVLDARFSWMFDDGLRHVAKKTENEDCKVRAKVVALSGCMDDQVSMDVFNICGENQFTGALTTTMLKVLKRTPDLRTDALKFLLEVRKELLERSFRQKPKLTTTHDLLAEPELFPKL